MRLYSLVIVWLYFLWICFLEFDMVIKRYILQRVCKSRKIDNLFFINQHIDCYYELKYQI